MDDPRKAFHFSIEKVNTNHQWLYERDIIVTHYEMGKLVLLAINYKRCYKARGIILILLAIDQSSKLICTATNFDEVIFDNLTWHYADHCSKLKKN